MGNLLPKFIYYKKGNYDERHSKFYEYCCDNNLPFVSIDTSGKKYWNIVYDTFTIKKFERFYAIKYDDFVRPFYKDYCEKTKLPSHKSLFGNFSFIVYKKDAPEIAEKLYDLLINLGKLDQERFDVNPFYVDEDGCNSEGTNVVNFLERLKGKSDDELKKEYRQIKAGNKYMLQHLGMINDEMTRRNIKSEK
jgi:hypothetical protein